MSSNIIALAVVLILALDPFSVLAVDFWLSFMAVIFILYITHFRISTHTRLFELIRLQVLLSIALLPLLAFWFKTVPIYSAVANIFSIPIIGFIVVPLLLLALLLLLFLPQCAMYLYHLADVINQFNISILQFLADQDHSLLNIALPNRFTLVLAIMGILILLLPRGFTIRWLGLVWLLPLFFPQVYKPDMEEFEFVLLDVGQGLAALIQTQHHVLIYDTGGRFSQRFNMGDAVLIPYLRYKGIDTVSMLLISHADNDHIGGALALLQQVKVDKILSSAPEKFYPKQAQACYAGQSWSWDGIEFEILHPRPSSISSRNNASCVLKVSSSYGTVLLTGDIEYQAEKSLLKYASDKLNSDVLVVPHHGSETSSTRAFIKQVAPKYAFFPVGYRNRFGFPKQSIIDRYEHLGIEMRYSYETGAISVHFQDSGIRIQEFRKQNKRLWHVGY